MSVPVRKMEQSPESYAPKSRPVIISMAEELCTEKILDTIVIEGVEFTIIEKAKTFGAGCRSELSVVSRQQRPNC